VSSLLVVAGEASGDRAAAQVVAHLRGVRVFGMGGGALMQEGAELVADLRSTTALGVAEVAQRAFGVALAYGRVRRAAARRRPAAALLVNYTEFNTRLARELSRQGTRVLWYGAPQVGAWRAARATPLRRHVDRMAVMLPFEEPLWRSHGVDAHYVGHPALEERARGRLDLGTVAPGTEDRVSAREMLGMTPRAWAIAILPGSRPHEVRRLLEPMLEGYEAVRRDRASVDGRVLLAPSLDPRTRAWAHAVCERGRVELVEVDARAGMSYALPAFDAALCASGTASLECALARAVPVICYRVGLATELGARAFMQTPFVGLPNVLLERAVFPELLQRACTKKDIAEALGAVLDAHQDLVTACADVEAALGGRTSASRAVARMLEPWLTVPRASTPRP
jgi:lipid-A-disaccharide synthase